METLSLFDMPEGVQEEIDAQPSNSLDVVKMEFVGAKTLSWKELFSGFSLSGCLPMAHLWYLR